MNIFTYICKKKNDMPTVFALSGLRFMFYSDDHEPIHIHVIKGKGRGARKAKFNIYPVVSLEDNDGLKPQELKLAESLITKNRQIIIDRWIDYFTNNK